MAGPTVAQPRDPVQAFVAEIKVWLEEAQAAAWLLNELHHTELDYLGRVADPKTQPMAEVRTRLTDLAIRSLVANLDAVRRLVDAAKCPKAVA